MKKLFFIFMIIISFAFINSDDKKLVSSFHIETSVFVEKDFLDDYLFPEYQHVEIKVDCSASCGRKSCSGSGSCTCSCGWFSCRCTPNPHFAHTEIYLSREDYLVHKGFAKMLFELNEEAGIEAAKVVGNWVSDVFETKGEKATEFEKIFFQIMTTASEELKETVNEFFENNGVADRV